MTTRKSGQGSGEHGDTPAGTSQAGASKTGVDPVLQGSLGRKLRDAYQEVVDEEVPSKFLTLLQELKKKEAGSSGDAQS